MEPVLVKKDKQPQDKGPPALPRSIYEANPHMVQNIKEEIRSCVVGAPGKPHTVYSMTKTTVQLPELRKLPIEFQRMLKEALFDQDMKETLKHAKALNWCRNIRPLYPLRTMGDGNCLLHAVSLAMWAIEDSTMLLRRLVYVTLVEDEEHGNIKKRWHKDRMRLNEASPDFMINLNSREWEQEWEMVVKAAEDRRLDNTSEGPNYGDLQYECLEEIHIFVLANVLKRPIIVVGDSVIRGMTGVPLAPNNFRGTYLPLLWKPDECIKTPIVLAYCNNHFAPLVSFIDTEDVADDACPLVTSDLEPFNVHFLLPHEESVVNRILQSYLNITEVTHTRPDAVVMVLAAKLTYTQISERLDLVRHYMYYTEKQYREYIKQKPAGVRDANVTLAKTLMSPHKEVKRLEDLHLSLPVSGEEDQEVRNEAATPVDPEPGSRADTRRAGSSLMCSVCGCRAGNHRYGGQCSQCYSSMMAEHTSSPPPSAPTQSLLTIVTPSRSLLDTYSWRTDLQESSHVGPEPEPLMEGLSMVNQLCEYPKCRNLSSVNTFPFCHAHANQKSRRPHSTPRVQSQQLQEAERHSFDESSLQPGRGQPCVEIGCDMYGLPEWGNRCSHHRAKASGKSTSPKGSESWQPCRNAGCKNHGKARYTGYCSECYRASSATQPLKPVPSSEALVSSLSSSTLSSGTSVRAETRQCIGPSCSNPGSDTYNGLCEECFTIILQGKTSATGSGVPRRKIRVSSADYEAEPPQGQHCLRQGCDMFGSPEFMGYCSQCWRSQHQAGKGSVQIGSGMVRLVRQPSPADVEYRVTTGVPVPLAHQCRNSRCDHRGDPAFSGFCPTCYGTGSVPAHHQYPSPPTTHTQPKSFSAPIVPSDPEEGMTTDEQYSRAMRRLEGSFRSSIRHCRKSGCKNFGNPKSQGFCNDCYKHEIQQHGHCCGRFPRNTGFDECDLNDTNT